MEAKLKNKTKKAVVAIVLFGVLAPSFILALPQKAWAEVPVADAVLRNKETGGAMGLCLKASATLGSIVGGALSNVPIIGGIFGGAGGIASNPACTDAAAYFLAQLLLRALSQSIINWIKTGGINGSPLYVENFSDFFRNELDNAAGIFLEEYLGSQVFSFICSPFRLQVGNLLNTTLLHRSFDRRARCTISDIVANVQNFQVDFTAGGWGGWIAMLEPNNNAAGSYLLATDEATKRQVEAFLASSYETLTTGGGLLAYKDCSQAPRTPDGQIDRSKCKIVSPGRVVADSLSGVITDDRIRLQLADELDEIIATAIDQLLITNITGGGGGKGLAGFDANAFERNNELLFGQQRDGVLSQLEQALAVEDQYLGLKESSLGAASTTIGTLNELKSCEAKLASGNPAAVDPRIKEIQDQRPKISSDVLASRAVGQELEVRILDVAKTRNSAELALINPAINQTILKIHDPAPARLELTDLQIKSSKAADDLIACQIAASAPTP
ncbi:MAG: hypothetical protein Q8Q97_02435 [bacterium]|nr:hypothetical protein [bacterium]